MDPDKLTEGYPRAQWPTRLGAALIDLVLVSALLQGAAVGADGGAIWSAPLYGKALFAAALLYLLLRDGLGLGQSLGKRALGVQVVELKERRPARMRESAVRNLPLFLGLLLSLVAHPIFVLVLGVEAVTVFQDAKGRRMGDRLAETQVIDGAMEHLAQGVTE